MYWIEIKLKILKLLLTNIFMGWRNCTSTDEQRWVRFVLGSVTGENLCFFGDRLSDFLLLTKCCLGDFNMFTVFKLTECDINIPKTYSTTWWWWSECGIPSVSRSVTSSKERYGYGNRVWIKGMGHLLSEISYRWINTKHIHWKLL